MKPFQEQPRTEALPAPTELAQPAAEVVHEHPTEGGSYTRDLSTGALVKAAPAPQTVPKE